jgi:hypothetical protein
MVGEKLTMTWSMVAQTLRRPYRVTIPMIILVSLVPFYIFIPELMAGRALHIPELALDRVVPLQPAWALVYGALYFFLILLPLFVVREEEQINRTVFAYLTVWIAAYVCFVLYPTAAPRPPKVIGDGFAVWGLRLLYSSDPPHYVLDVIAGLLLACVAYVVFLRNSPREKIPETDRRIAPVLAFGIIAAMALGVAGYWVVYELTGQA